MAGDRPFVWINTHEELARLGKELNKLPVMGQELLNGFIVTEISEVREYRHEPFRFERKRVHVDLRRWVCGIGDPFALNLVGEKGGNDGKEPIDDVVLSNNVEGD